MEEVILGFPSFIAVIAFIKKKKKNRIRGVLEKVPHQLQFIDTVTLLKSFSTHFGIHLLELCLLLPPLSLH